jgi:hypothetical protein
VSVKITAVYYDPYAGPDPDTNRGRNLEYAVIRNAGRRATRADPVALHWDGTFWTAMSPPVPGSGAVSAPLLGADAVGASDVWAVGSRQRVQLPTTGALHPFATHWDGSAWTRYPTPSRGSKNSWLQSVAAVSTNDAWAVGGTRNHRYAMASGHTLVERWDGTSWHRFRTPRLAGSVFSAIAISADGTGWAVGDRTNANGQERTLIEVSCGM